MRTNSNIIGIIVTVLLLCGTVYMSYVTHRLSLRNEEREVNTKVDEINNRLQHQFNFCRVAAFSMQNIIDSKGNIGPFDSIAAIIMEQSDYLDAVQLVPNGIITHVYPLEGNEVVIDYDILMDPEVNLEVKRTVTRNEMFFAGPFELKQGGMGVVGRWPVYIKGKLWGFTAVVIRMERLFRNAGIENLEGSAYRLQFAKDNPNTGEEQFFLEGGKMADMDKHAHSISFVFEGDWRIYVLPTDPYRTYYGAMLLLLVGGLMSIVIGLFVRKTMLSSQQLSKTNEALRLQRDDIQDGINNAKYLQQSVLQSFEELQVVFPNSFEISRPRNVVSGDFHWSFQRGDERFIAVVDCTGHGISGALLSMIGVQFLNQLVKQQGETSPAKIITRLDEEITNLLANSSSRHNSDGMDMILARYDQKSEVLTFAGAQRPLYYCRSGELTELPGSKFGVGGHVIPGIEKRFTETSLDLANGSMIYLTTDGFHSQFGGPDGRKMGRSKLRKMLAAVSMLSLKEQQEALTKQLDVWKGEEAQVDDILLIGLKMGR